ncbi:MAG: hypothetical protein C0395_08240, partial [Gemmatimonas sp.]|nr:hypothetical protein [Gemmatimonas sp.]
YILDYETDEAYQRLSERLTAVALEMSDQSVAIEITNFEATRDNGVVVLTWNTHDCRSMPVEIYRSHSGSPRERLPSGLLDACTTVTFVDGDPPAGSQQYWMKTSGVPGEEAWIAHTVIAGTEVSGNLSISALEPNPFNPRTSFEIFVPRSGRVEVHIYDQMGRHIRNLLDAPLPAGNRRITWNGDDDEGREVPSGMYLVRVRAQDHQVMAKALLLR